MASKENISKENRNRRKEIRNMVKEAVALGHVAVFPIKVSFRSSSAMEYDWACAVLKGEGKDRYFDVSFEARFVNSDLGRDLCLTLLVHELAHVFTWSENKEVEDAKTAKYGEHGPEFGVVYAQLWTDLMNGFVY